MPKKVDRNQPEIVKALRSMGATVECLHAVGKGCPDLLVGYRGINLLMEVKDGEKVASARKLTLDQEKWHNRWQGQRAVVKNISEAADFLHRVRRDLWRQ